MQTEHVIILSVLGLVVLLSIGNLVMIWNVGHELVTRIDDITSKVDDTYNRVARMSKVFDDTRARLCKVFPKLCQGNFIPGLPTPDTFDPKDNPDNQPDDNPDNQ